jgi:hypothetical protein
MPYFAEYTDTFGGEANYSWVRRAAFEMPERASKRAILQRARRELGLTGARGDVTADFGDEYHWVPRGCCTILMVRWDYSPETMRLLSETRA